MGTESQSTTDKTPLKDGTGAPGQSAPGWTSKQAYGLSVLCLLLGIPIGYFLRAPQQALPPAPETHAEPQKSMPQGHANLADITPERLKRMADKTAKPLLEKLEQDSSDPKVLLDLGNVYAATRQYDLAIAYYERAAAINADAMVLTQLATAYHLSGSTDKALATLDRALQKDPKFANALVNIGVIKLKARGDKVGAIAAWEKFLKTNPNHPGREQVQQMIARARQENVAQKSGASEPPAR